MNYTVTGDQLTAIANAIRMRSIGEDIIVNAYALITDEIDTTKDYLLSGIMPSMLFGDTCDITIAYLDSNNAQLDTLDVSYLATENGSYVRMYFSMKPPAGYPAGTKYLKVKSKPSSFTAITISEMKQYTFPTGFVNAIGSIH